MHQTQIQVASRLLGHLLQQRTTRLPPHEVEDIQYALDLAAELLRLGGPGPASQTQASAMVRTGPIRPARISSLQCLPTNSTRGVRNHCTTRSNSPALIDHA